MCFNIKRMYMYFKDWATENVCPAELYINKMHAFWYWIDVMNFDTKNNILDEPMTN